MTKYIIPILILFISACGETPEQKNKTQDNTTKNKSTTDTKAFLLFHIENINDLTATNFVTQYRNNTGKLLKDHNLNINSKISIGLRNLESLIALKNNPKYLKILLIQVPEFSHFTHTYLSNQINNLYFLYTLTDQNGIQYPEIGYYDINENLTTIELFQSTEIAQCLALFENDLKPILEKRVSPNTTSIFVNLSLLKNVLSFNKFKSSQNSQIFSHIDLRFCEVNKDAPNLSTEQINKAQYDHNKFAILWETYDVNNRRILGVPIYDMNDLCPTHCPNAK